MAKKRMAAKKPVSKKPRIRTPNSSTANKKLNRSETSAGQSPRSVSGGTPRSFSVGGSPMSVSQNLSLSQSRSFQQKKTGKTSSKKKRTRIYDRMIVGNKIFKITRKTFREIKRLQSSTNNLIPKLSFSRLVYQILFERLPTGGRIQRTAIQALQESAEVYLVQFFEDSYSCSLHARRCTLLPRDMGLIQHLRRDY